METRDERFEDTNVEVIGETEVYVKEKKHPIRDFFANHPAVTTVIVGILAGLGGYAVGNLTCDDDDYEEFDLDDEPLTIEEATTETIE